MEDMVNEMLLESYFEEGLALGLSDEDAEKYALKCFEERGI
jgi:hypothetical protein